MSLFGALFSAVAGLTAQANKIGAISDNISNASTIGYKGVEGSFQTLVTSSGGGSAYSSGGVLGVVKQLIDQQGLLQATSSATDIAISGGGFFVVNQNSDGTGQVLYTRAGSFTQDATGNFRNSAGFFLQAWPLNRDGLLPGEPGNENTLSSANLSSLRTVNVQNLTGVAAATTLVSLGANLKASEKIFSGTGLTASFDSNDSINALNASKSIIIPQGSGNVDSLTRDDEFNIATGANPTGYDFTYGGFAIGRLVTSGADGDYEDVGLGTDYKAGNGQTTLANNSFATTNTSTTVVVTHTSHGLENGETIELSGATAVGGILAGALAGTFVVTVINANSYSIEAATAATSTVAAGGGAVIVEDTLPYADAGFILDAATPTQSFLGTTGTTPFVTAALSFTISTLATGTATFTYKASSPNTQAGQFNNLNNLADAISAVDGLSARVSGGRLYVTAIDAQQAITFANGSKEGVEGSNAGEALYGIDWVRELGLYDVAAGSGRYSTLQGLSDLVNTTAELTAKISSPLSDASLLINVDDPLDTIVFTDGDYGGSPDNVGSPLAALGFEDVASLGDVIPTGAGDSTGDLGPAYDPADGTKNMASGNIVPQFSRPIRIFDSLGSGHDINVAFIKTAANKWAVEIYAIDPTEVTTSNGLLASGNLVFNGDGTLQSVSSGLVNPIDIDWASLITDPEDSEVTFNWGTAGTTGDGKADGMGQFDTNYKVNFANQNGAQVGELTGVSIDEDGFITVSYSNGETQQLFKIPLGHFNAPNSLQLVTGNVFAQTSASGEVNLSESGTSGVGKVASSSLEASNVDLAGQLTDMIVAQRAYQANTKVIQTTDQLLTNLNDILR
jgi:flagellar hook protein FlgE